MFLFYHNTFKSAFVLTFSFLRFFYLLIKTRFFCHCKHSPLRNLSSSFSGSLLVKNFSKTLKHFETFSLTTENSFLNIPCYQIKYIKPLDTCSLFFWRRSSNLFLFFTETSQPYPFLLLHRSLITLLYFLLVFLRPLSPAFLSPFNFFFYPIFDLFSSTLASSLYILSQQTVRLLWIYFTLVVPKSSDPTLSSLCCISIQVPDSYHFS